MLLPPDIRIIDELGINERTIVSWYDKATQDFGFGIFHISEQPNVVSKISLYTMWGYLVYTAPPIKDHAEAAEVYDLFLTDLIKGDYWFEDDSNFEIPEELQHLMEDVQKGLDKLEPRVDARTKLTLVKTEEVNETTI
jgi:hypothetical protein